MGADRLACRRLRATGAEAGTEAGREIRAALLAETAPKRDQVYAAGAQRYMKSDRVSIICQLGFKGDTDLGLLYGCIEPNLEDREFFIRKAIGWALRDYAWFAPVEVDRYVHEHEGRLSGLSRREATKNLARLLE